MIKRFIEYDKLREYVAVQFENIFSFISAFLTVAILYFADFYSDFEQYKLLINDLYVGLIGAYIGSLALIFSGIVFLGSLLNNKFEKDLIRYTKDPKVVDRLYMSYLFLAFNVLCIIVTTFIVMIISNSKVPKPNQIVFFGVVFLYVYLSFYVMAYLVALIRNTIDLIRIDDKKKDMKSFFDRANEIRIDMIFEYLYSRESPEEMKRDLKKYITNYISLLDCSPEERKALEEYFTEYYNLY